MSNAVAAKRIVEHKNSYAAILNVFKSRCGTALQISHAQRFAAIWKPDSSLSCVGSARSTAPLPPSAASSSTVTTVGVSQPSQSSLITLSQTSSQTTLSQSSSQTPPADSRAPRARWSSAEDASISAWIASSGIGNQSGNLKWSDIYPLRPELLSRFSLPQIQSKVSQITSSKHFAERLRRLDPAWSLAQSSLLLSYVDSCRLICPDPLHSLRFWEAAYATRPSLLTHFNLGELSRHYDRLCDQRNPQDPCDEESDSRPDPPLSDKKRKGRTRFSSRGTSDDEDRTSDSSHEPPLRKSRTRPHEPCHSSPDESVSDPCSTMGHDWLSQSSQSQHALASTRVCLRCGLELTS